LWIVALRAPDEFEKTRECSLASRLLCCHWVAHRSRRFLAETTAALVAESLRFILEFSLAGGASDHGRPPSHELIEPLAASPPPSSSAIAPTHARSPLRRLGSPAAHERKGSTRRQHRCSWGLGRPCLPGVSRAIRRPVAGAGGAPPRAPPTGG